MTLTGDDVADGEQADADVTVHHPLLRLAVRFAAVVHEPRVVPLRTGVDDPATEPSGRRTVINNVDVANATGPRFY